MKRSDFPKDIQPHLIPQQSGHLVYDCISCKKSFDITKMLYTCPECGSVLLINDTQFDRLHQLPGTLWQRIFDYRKMLNTSALRGIFRFHEFIGPIIPLNAVVYLGEGDSPVIEANPVLQKKVGLRFFFKNEGQNPSASFKDRGMASALSYIHYLIQEKKADRILALCASTGDTSAAAALYSGYLNPHITAAVLLPHGKITPQQLSQALGSGAKVFEIPGVFDDCMKVVEHLSENHPVCLLNSKNPWRILGQESFAYELSQSFDYQMEDKVVFLPVGNAGNISAIMKGFIKFFQTGIIKALPKIIGVQSKHANPVVQYYESFSDHEDTFKPVKVKSSVAQAAMIGNPVSMPRVIHLVRQYNKLAGEKSVHFIEVNEQDIMDSQLMANQNGHIACTHGGECLAGLIKALTTEIIDTKSIAILNSTAHSLKFSGFQEMYFQNTFPDAFQITPKPELINTPCYIAPDSFDRRDPAVPQSNHSQSFIVELSDKIARNLHLV